MLTKEELQNLHRRQVEINKQQEALNAEFGKYKNELKERAWEILEWKDKYFSWETIRFKSKFASSIELRENCLTVHLVDRDPEIRDNHINIHYDELLSDDWKEAALEAYEQKKLQKVEEERAAKEKEQADKEAWERAEYERLKEKFED